jgi:multisubunit Na+/H+ antiporter MnhB subunit
MKLDSPHADSSETSLLLKAAAMPILWVQFLLSLFLLFRGHNEPGGGFSGGLLAAAAMALYAMAFDVGKARALIRFSPQSVMGFGLAIAAASGVMGLLFNFPYMTGLWALSFDVPVIGKLSLGTPLIFDIGVYFTVMGMTMMVIFALFERGHGGGNDSSDPPSGGKGLMWD